MLFEQIVPFLIAPQALIFRRSIAAADADDKRNAMGDAKRKNFDGMLSMVSVNGDNILFFGEAAEIVDVVEVIIVDERKRMAAVIGE